MSREEQKVAVALLGVVAVAGIGFLALASKNKAGRELAEKVKEAALGNIMEEVASDNE